MTDKEKESELEFEVKEVEGELDDEMTEVGGKPAAKHKPEDELDADKSADDEEDDGGEDDGDDERVGLDENEDEGETSEAKRAKRRDARKRAKLKRQVLMQNMQELIQAQSAQLAQLTGRQNQTEAAQIANGMRAAQAKYREAEEVYALAISKADGRTAAEAQRYKDAAAQEYRRLDGLRTQVQKPAAHVPVAVNPDVAAAATEWVTANPWYKHGGNDSDSRLVAEIDKKLAASGLDPSSPVYWQELTDQSKKFLPHRFKSASSKAKDNDTARGGPPTSSGRSSVKPTGKKSVHISPARRKTLEDMNVWGDAKAMQPYLKAFAEYDTQNKKR